MRRFPNWTVSMKTVNSSLHVKRHVNCLQLSRILLTMKSEFHTLQNTSCELSDNIENTDESH